VEPVRNKGFRVSTMSEEDLDQVAAIRELLEPAGVATATTLASPGDLEALRPLAQRIVAAARSGDLTTYLEADRDFHLRLLSLSGNLRLVDVVGRLRAQTRLFGLAPLAERGVLVHSADEHLALLELMAKGDAEAAEALVARHIGHVRGVWAGRGEK
jgi:DNA-binding GntR family transcriptional regulator